MKERSSRPTRLRRANLSDSFSLSQLLLLKLSPQDLERRALWQLTAKLHLAWHLVRRQVFATVDQDFLDAGLYRRSEHDERLDRFPALLIGDADRRRFEHRGMAHQHAVDFVGIYLVPTGVDHLFLATDDLEEPVAVHHRDVTGVQPAVA